MSNNVFGPDFSQASAPAPAPAPAGDTITVVNVGSGTSITPTIVQFGSYFNITSALITSIVLPSTGLTAGDAGKFWVFRNNSSVNLTVTLTNGTVSGLSTITIGQLNAVTFAYTGTSTTYTLF